MATIDREKDRLAKELRQKYYQHTSIDPATGKTANGLSLPELYSQIRSDITRWQDMESRAMQPITNANRWSQADRLLTQYRPTVSSPYNPPTQSGTPGTPGGQTNLNNIPSIYQMYQDRQKLLGGELSEQQRLINQQADIARDSLTKQLERQRQDYLRGQQAALDSGYDRGRKLTNALADRGLMTSGLMQLGDVQNKMATGQTLSSLAEANRDVSEAAMQAEQAIASGLVDAMNRAGLDYRRGMLESDQTAFSQDQSMKAQQMDYALALLDSMRDENMDPATRDALLSIMSPYLSDATAGTDGESLLDVIKGVAPSTAGELGDSKFKDKIDWTDLTNVSSLLKGDKNILQALSSPIQSTWGKKIWGVGNNPVRFNLPGMGSQTFKNIDDALVEINKFYSGKPHSDKIKAVASKNSLGARTGGVRFEVNGRQFKTYNEALNYYNNTYK